MQNAAGPSEDDVERRVDEMWVNAKKKIEGIDSGEKVVVILPRY